MSRKPISEIKPDREYYVAGEPLDHLKSAGEGSAAPADDEFAAYDAIMSKLAAEVGYDPYVGDDSFKRRLLSSVCRIVFFSGVKGGGGKSTACSGFIETAVAAGHRPLIIEADRRAKDVGPAYRKNTALRVAPIILAVPEGMQHLHRAMVTKPRLIVVNCPSGLTEPFDDFGGVLKEMLRATGYEMDMFWILNSQQQAIDELGEFRRLMPQANLHAVLNLKEAAYNRISDFHFWKDSPHREPVEAQGRTLVMPVGAMALMNRMEFEKLGFRALVQEERFDFFDRDTLNGWLDEMRRQYERVFTF